jgi:hypothetical protein
MLVGVVVMPWLVTLTLCPNVFAAYASVNPSLILKAECIRLRMGYRQRCVRPVLCANRLHVDGRNFGRARRVDRRDCTYDREGHRVFQDHVGSPLDEPF